MNKGGDSGLDWIREIDYPTRVKVSGIIARIIELTQHVGLVVVEDGEQLRQRFAQYHHICGLHPDLAKKESFNGVFVLSIASFRNLLRTIDVLKNNDRTSEVLRGQIQAFEEIADPEMKELRSLIKI